jgi:hypothetical protein
LIARCDLNDIVVVVTVKVESVLGVVEVVRVNIDPPAPETRKGATSLEKSEDLAYVPLEKPSALVGVQRA